jgi:hypothetical protein
MLSIFTRIPAIMVVLVLSGGACAAQDTTLAQFKMLPAGDESICLTRAVDNVANTMSANDPGFGRRVRFLFSHVPANGVRPLGLQEFYRDFGLIERLGENGRTNETKITVEWIVEDVVRQNFKDLLY